MAPKMKNQEKQESTMIDLPTPTRAAQDDPWHRQAAVSHVPTFNPRFHEEQDRYDGALAR